MSTMADLQHDLYQKLDDIFVSWMQSHHLILNTNYTTVELRRLFASAKMRPTGNSAEELTKCSETHPWSSDFDGGLTEADALCCKSFQRESSGQPAQVWLRSPSETMSRDCDPLCLFSWVQETVSCSQEALCLSNSSGPGSVWGLLLESDPLPFQQGHRPNCSGLNTCQQASGSVWRILCPNYDGRPRGLFPHLQLSGPRGLSAQFCLVGPGDLPVQTSSGILPGLLMGRWVSVISWGWRLVPSPIVISLENILEKPGMGCSRLELKLSGLVRSRSELPENTCTTSVSSGWRFIVIRINWWGACFLTSTSSWYWQLQKFEGYVSCLVRNKR